MDTKIGAVDTCAAACNDIGSPPNGAVSTISATPINFNSSEATLGRHLARRLVQIGVSDVFSVPGDFNLTLLDHLLAEPGLNLVGCCNELNAGYAADGYARSRGVGACVVTFTVGGLSVINAIAGAYSENLPLICIVGGPNSNDYGTNRVLHHTIGSPDFSQELRCFQTVTCFQAVVNNLDDAHELIDTAISTALKESKPVYISVGCNLAAIPHPTFNREPVPFSLSPKLSNKMGLEAAVEATAEFLNKAVKPVLVGGPKMRVANASEAFVELADVCGYPVAVMPSAKGMVPEHHPHFIGTYWGAVSTAFCAEIVESADAYLFAGPIFNDYSSVGYSLLLKKEKAIILQPDRVVIANGPTFGCVLMKDFLQALAKRLKRNTTAYENYHRIYVPEGHPLKCAPMEPLRVNVLFQHIQKMLSGETAVIAETGDSWFNCQKLKLPKGCGYEFQMQYGSIGWSVGATLGYAQAAKDKRVIACIGDGSFQVTAQDVSTMLRCGQNQIIFLINNGGYTIEVEIHDGPYNVIKNWNYTALVDAIHNGEGKCWTTKVIFKMGFNPLFTIIKDNKLTGPNYIEWKRNLDIVLTADDYKFCIIEPQPDRPNDDASESEKEYYKKWVKADEMSRCYILAAMSSVLQHQHQNMTTASDMLFNLKELFGDQNRAARQVAMKALMNTQMVEGTPVRDHVLRMMSHLNEMEILGADIDGETQVDIILMSLPKSFEQFRLNYNMNKRMYSLAELMTELQAAEGLFQQSVYVNVAEKGSSSKPKGKVKKKKAQTKAGAQKAVGVQGGIKKPKGKCFRCKQSGHWKANCPLPKKTNDAGVRANQAA